MADSAQEGPTSLELTLNQLTERRFDDRLRGYDRAQVDAFLAEVVADFEGVLRGEAPVMAPEFVADRTFDESLRGYDRDQVRSVLHAAARAHENLLSPLGPAAVGALEEVGGDDRASEGAGVLLAAGRPGHEELPGRHAAAILAAAEAEAEAIRAEAERIRTQAMAEVDRLRADADQARLESARAQQDSARRVDRFVRTAQRIRADVEAEAERIKAEAKLAAAAIAAEADKLLGDAAEANDAARREQAAAQKVRTEAKQEATRIIYLSTTRASEMAQQQLQAQTEANDLRERALAEAREAEDRRVAADVLRSQAEELRQQAEREAAHLREVAEEDLRSGGAAPISDIREACLLLDTLLTQLRTFNSDRGHQLAEAVRGLEDRIGVAVGELHQELDDAGTEAAAALVVAEQHLRRMSEQLSPTMRAEPVNPTAPRQP